MIKNEMQTIKVKKYENIKKQEMYKYGEWITWYKLTRCAKTYLA